MVIYRADALQLIRKFADPKKKSVYIEKTLNEAAGLFGINSNMLGYAVDDSKAEAQLHSIFKKLNEEKGVAMPADVFESNGTVRFVNIFPLVVSAILNGGTLIVDEFDASIHPMALMSITNIFHNDEINVHKAQLIFNNLCEKSAAYRSGRLLAQVVKKMKQSGHLGKKITYKSGYSNFTFELWIILHKSDCFGHLSYRSQYLMPINQAYGEQFDNLDQYKHEDNFKRILRKLCLQDVKNAVQRSRIITARNQEHGYSLISYRGYSYYRENPSLLIWESVSKILSDSGLDHA